MNIEGVLKVVGPIIGSSKIMPFRWIAIQTESEGTVFVLLVGAKKVTAIDSIVPLVEQTVKEDNKIFVPTLRTTIKLEGIVSDVFDGESHYVLLPEGTMHIEFDVGNT